MDNQNDVVLQHYTSAHMDALKNFRLPEEQARFTSMPTEYAEIEEGQHRIVILTENNPVGFFILDASEKVKIYISSDKTMLLTSLLIDHEAQGKGYAQQALNKLQAFIQSEFPDCNQIVLSVNHKNKAARKLYEKTGFQDTGRTIGGPAGEQSIMKLEI